MNNIIDDFSEWHKEQHGRGLVRFASIIRPSDRKHWAMAWFTIYRNGDVIAFSEWPDYEYHTCTSTPTMHVEDYRDVILDAEKTIRNTSDMRFIHPAYGVRRGQGIVRTIRQILSGTCRECWHRVSCREYDDLDERSQDFQQAYRNCKHKLSYLPWPEYPGSDRDGHMRVRTALGDAEKGIRPKLYFIKPGVPNLIHAMQNYAWADERDTQNEKGSELNSEFPSLVAGGYLKRFDNWPEEPRPALIIPRRRH